MDTQSSSTVPVTPKSPLIVVAAIVIVALGVGAYLWFGSRPPDAPAPALVSPEVEAVPQTPEVVENTVHEAQLTGDFAVCDSLQGDQQKAICRNEIINSKARTADDPLVCDEITDAVVRSGCKDGVVYGRAIHAQDPSLCATIVDKVLAKECVARAQGKVPQ